MKPNGVRRILSFLTPATFGIAYVLLSFAQFPTTASDLIRPIAIVIVAAVVLVLAFRAVLRSLPNAIIAASGCLVILSAPIVFVAVVVAGGAWMALRLVRRRRAGREGAGLTGAASVSRSLAAFGLAFLIVAAAVASPSILTSIFLPKGSMAQTGAKSASNIYVLLLDGYPRNDTLAETFNFDNSAFEAGLEEMGFAISPRSRSNYPHTWLTLTSMFNGAYLDDMPALMPPPAAPEEQYRRLMQALNEAAMLDRLREQGYEIFAIPSPFRSVALQTADQYLDGGQLTAFEYSLLMHSQLAAPVTHLTPDFLMSQQRDRFGDALARIRTLALDDRERPKFLFAHLFSPPHAPLVYGRNGEKLPLPDCVPTSCALWEFPADAWDRLPDQIHYTNGELLELMEDVVQRDPEATIILMSDHGSRRQRSDLDEFFHTFFAARTPGRSAFPADISPVNVLRLLVSTGTGGQLDELPYRAWSFADQVRPLDLSPFQPSP